MYTIEIFHSQNPPKIIAKLELYEAGMRLEKTLSIDEDVDEEFTHWIPYNGSSRSREIKYHLTNFI